MRCGIYIRISGNPQNRKLLHSSARLPMPMLNWPRGARFTVNIILFVMPVFMVSCAFVSDDDVKQPIAYNHRVHIENAGLKCQECHLYVETMASATLPSIEICRTCHETAPL